MQADTTTIAANDRSLALEEALRTLGNGQDLSVDQARSAVAQIMEGQGSEATIAAFLTALRVKGETAEELSGAVEAVRARMTPLEVSQRPILDTCGTGGDGANTVNVSTATALLAAACGVATAKHGNRSATGNSGSAEVLTELGITIEAEPPALQACLAELGIAFLFAPRFHPALRFAGPVRKQLPFRTLFNLVGPLANPARPDFQLVGAPGERPASLIASALSRLGVGRAAVVTGFDGLDEVTLDGPTKVLWVEHGQVTRRTWQPADFGLSEVRAADLRVSGPAESANRIRKLLEGEQGPVREIVLANTAAALFVAGQVSDLKAGVERSARALDSGDALRLLDRWRERPQAG